MKSSTIPLFFFVLTPNAAVNGLFVLNRPTNALEGINVILLHNKQRHVSANHVTIFRVRRTIIKLSLKSVNPHYNVTVFLFSPP
jgi:hypothetical protein